MMITHEYMDMKNKIYIIFCECEDVSYVCASTAAGVKMSPASNERYGDSSLLR